MAAAHTMFAGAAICAGALLLPAAYLLLLWDARAPLGPLPAARRAGRLPQYWAPERTAAAEAEDGGYDYESEERLRKWSAPAINADRLRGMERDRLHPVKPHEIFHSAHRMTFTDAHNHGTGNAMMAYAALYGLSRLHRVDALVRTAQTSALYAWFELSLPVVDGAGKTFSGALSISEGGLCCRPQPQFFVPPNGTRSVVISGYTATYKYFGWVMDELRRREFRFRPLVLAECQERLRDAVAATLPANGTVTMADCTYVGVHCRRGDFANAGKMNFGHQPALSSYLQNAVRYFRDKLSSAACIRFVVLGNDEQWNREAMVTNSTGDEQMVIMQPHESSAVDMCILAQCNHTIGTTGTFSWWAAFLSGGHVTYQRPWVRPNSSLEKQYTQADFFPPHWVPIDA